MTQRIITGVALVGILVLALWGGGLWFSVPYMVTICMSMYEMIRATAQAGHRPVQWPCWLCVVLSIPLFHFVGSVSLLMPLIGGAFMLIAMVVIAGALIVGLWMWTHGKRETVEKLLRKLADMEDDLK